MKNDTKKTIHIIAKHFYPVMGGAIINVAETYSYLVKNGWRVIIHTTKNTRSEKNVLPDFGEYNGIKIRRYNDLKFKFIPLIQNVEYNQIGNISLHGSSIFPNYYIYLYTILLKILRRKKYSLFLTTHGLFNLDIGNPVLKMKFKKIIDYMLGIFLINHSVDGLRAVSNWEKQLLINAKIKPKLIKVIPNGLPEEAFISTKDYSSKNIKNKTKNLKKYLIQVARIDRTKNFEVVIKALKLLPEDVKFLIVGPDHNAPYKKELLKLVKQLDLEERVIFMGTVKGTDKYLLMKKSEMMIHMARLEGFCNSVHEGMSQGLVCIVSNNTALPELITNKVNGYCLDINDYQGLARKINYVLENKDDSIIKNMKMKNRQFTAGHTWENIAKQIEKYYLSIINKYSNKYSINWIRTN